MLRFKLIYHDQYQLPLGNHVFAGQKYRLVRQALLAQQLAEPADFLTPAPASDSDMCLVHTPEWVGKLRQAKLDGREEMLLELPYSPALVDAFWIHVGGSILAAQRALEDQVSINLGGGFHHAFPDHGEGFCMVHDVAVAIRRMMKEGRIARAMVIDCDVHQGNGTAAIFNPVAAAASRTEAWSAPMFQAPRPVSISEVPAGEVFTVSLHQENNYPQWKPPSSLDVNLPDGTNDADYLNWLDNALSSAFRQFAPDLIAYVAGADPYRYDQLGGLALTIDGLKQRDAMVFGAARRHRVPIFSTAAGGYAQRIEDTVTIHVNTVAAAKEIFSKQKVRR